MLDKIKSLFKSKSSKTAKQMQDSPEPWVNVVKAHIDKKDPKQGYFELEWNPAFVKNLIAAGYYGPTPEAVVDQWFTELCRNISQDQAADQNFVAQAGRASTNERTRKQ